LKALGLGSMEQVCLDHVCCAKEVGTTYGHAIKPTAHVVVPVGDRIPSDPRDLRPTDRTVVRKRCAVTDDALEAL
jgi:hypothetical protein